MSFENCPDVRLATMEDIPELFRLVKMGCEEDGKTPIDEIKVIDGLKKHFDKQGVLIGVIGDRGGELKASICLAVTEYWFSSNKHLQEMGLYVSPEHRRSNFAKQLMSFAKQSADALGLELMIGVMSNERTEAKVRLYERQFRKIGAFFAYNVPNA